MKIFLHLFRHDLRLLQRHRILAVSALVTAVYIVILRGIAHFGNADKLLIMIIFNDPALLGFLFAGVMVLFERNENTLQALAVSPLTVRCYILSKTAALTLISLVCCYLMAFFMVGTGFIFAHYFFASLITTCLFTFLGFMLVSRETTFNRFMLRSVGFLIVLSLPFLGYFGLARRAWFLLLPTQPCLDLFRLAFNGELSMGETLYAYLGSGLWTALAFKVANRLFTKNFR